jgi:hypothetical protein
MDLTRRDLLAGFSGLAVSGALATEAHAQADSSRTTVAGSAFALPRKSDLAIA